MIQLKQMKLKEKINFALLGVLWFLASTLGMCFFINTAFNFNILSAEHWQYLSSLQASGENINIFFYISLCICISIIVIGLYIITISIYKTPKHTDEQTINKDTIYEQQQILEHEKKYLPPRLNIPRGVNISAIQNQIKNIETQKNIQQQEQQNLDKILSILSNAGYQNQPIQTYKNKKYIVSLGYDATMWLGVTNSDPDYITELQTKFTDIFNEFLEDTFITINTFIIFKTGDTESQDILQFSSINEFEQYVSEKPNINNSDEDDLPMFSQFISTVLTNIGKL
ncbi:MAG: hypothetical protein ACLRFI_01320 [Alphaproteobacteria bacterium]